MRLLCRLDIHWASEWERIPGQPFMVLRCLKCHRILETRCTTDILDWFHDPPPVGSDTTDKPPPPVA